ncbi:energy transducer TonB [Sphingosinicella sp.]|uniref:energy transducer TonB n=1 Tax=Sphingosinicella sp. TaxID=1917971 RepID=UPI0017CF6DF8|nr:energy transducer TonB [Sphingosinicella sp.]MBA4757603.1 energy transducer TonB [Sphingosinicella sp.]
MKDGTVDRQGGTTKPFVEGRKFDTSRFGVIFLTLALHGVLLAAISAAFHVVFPGEVQPSRQPLVFDLQSHGSAPRPQPDEGIKGTIGRTVAPRPLPRSMPAPLPVANTVGLQALADPPLEPTANTDSVDVDAYRRSLHDRIVAARVYPEASRQAREEGSAQIAFVLHRDGTVSDLEVVQSSGHRSLDAAARDAVSRAEPFPVIPAALPDLVDIRVPVVFVLERTSVRQVASR